MNVLCYFNNCCYKSDVKLLRNSIVMSHIIYIYIYSSIGLFEVLKTKGKFLDGFALNFCLALWNIYIYFESVSFFNEQGYIFFMIK